MLCAWEVLASKVPTAAEQPRVVDSVLTRIERPVDALTLYRERHGWCPYSEKVWLALELKGLQYDTVLIDNMGGGRPSWYRGSTPQIMWPDGNTQGESMDLVKKLDDFYPETRPLWPPHGGSSAAEVAEMVNGFRHAFPSNARPSSRAAFLFSYDGPLPRSTFERCLDATDALLAKHASGPFFVGAELSAADVSWAPFLERYAAQLPCLHEGLTPRDPVRWPHLHAWFEAMDKVPEYACRIKGDNISWARVLSMQGYGNSGKVPKTTGYVAGSDTHSATLWDAYAGARPFVATDAAAEAAACIVRNRARIAKDALAHETGSTGCAAVDPYTAQDVDEGLRLVASALLETVVLEEMSSESLRLGAGLAAYLVSRICVPRDMGVPSAMELRQVARRFEEAVGYS